LEGLKSLHLADGVFNIYQTGNEFELIFPTWDWERIPGITCALGEVPNNCNTLKVLGKTDFVGGVSDGTYGAAAYAFEAALNGKLSAKKAWFFFDFGVVALGNSITCAGCGYPIVTSINQCLLRGDVFTSNSTTAPLPTGNFTLHNTKWVWHGGVGYIVDEPSIGVANGIQTGTWQSIGASVGNAAEKVFNFWINQKDGGDEYAYYVVPNVTVETFAATTVPEVLGNVVVLANTPQFQAVLDKELNVLQVVFWEAGNFTLASYWVSANSPCIVMVASSKSGMTISVADPTHTLTSLTVTVGVALQGKGCVAKGHSTVLTYTLPTGEFAGQSMSLTCTS